MTDKEKKELKDLREAIDKINTILLEGFMVKSKGFKEQDGFKILDIIEDLEKKYNNE